LLEKVIIGGNRQDYDYVIYGKNHKNIKKKSSKSNKIPNNLKNKNQNMVEKL